ncbi:MAG: exonuclease SbcCD subunit D [Bacteroidales bacterium]|jgi:exonuclease SbcD|nr:exonuclease SbcCD subunit D [Bacteroidales bacterium]
MKFVHTADWHLGQTFFEYDRKAEHLCFLEWLKCLICEQEADALLVAGDIFDSPNPSAESQRVFYAFLKEITTLRPQLQIVMIAGNHDSAARLEAPNPLLELMNVTVRGVVRKNEDGTIDSRRLIVPLMRGDTTVAWCLAVPYLHQGDYPDAESYMQGVEKIYETLYAQVPDKSKPVVAMGHLHVTGAAVSENDRSERIVVGGLECVSPKSFAGGIAYVALGHLHRAQQVDGRYHVRYAGAPLPMSFAEKNYRQGVMLVTIDETTHRTTVEQMPFEPPVKLIGIPQYPKPLADVLKEIHALPEGDVLPQSPYIEISVLMNEPNPSLQYLVEEALKHKAVRLTRLSRVMPSINHTSDTPEQHELQNIHPIDMAKDVYRKRFGEELPHALCVLLQEAVEMAET